MGPLRGEDLALIGVFAAKEPYDSPLWETYEVIARGLNEQGGLPGPDGRKPVLLVACDDERATIDAAMDHLLHQLGVRAVLAPGDRSSAEAVVQSLGPNDDPLLFLPSSNDIVNTSGKDIWSMPPEQPDTAAQVALLSRLAAQIGPLHLATVVSEANADRVLTLDLATRFAAHADSFIATVPTVANFALPDADVASRSMVLQQLVASRPDVVLVFASGYFERPRARARLSLIRDLEDLWPAGVARPYYILSPLNADEYVGDLLEDESLGARVIGLRSVREEGTAATQSVPDGPAFEQRLRVYDGVYYLAYASAAAHTEAMSLRSAMQRLTADGEELVDVGIGQSGTDLGFALLDGRTPFALRGAAELPVSEVVSQASGQWAPLRRVEVYCPVLEMSEEAPAPGGVEFDRTAEDFVAAPAPAPRCLEGIVDGAP